MDFLVRADRFKIVNPPSSIEQVGNRFEGSIHRPRKSEIQQVRVEWMEQLLFKESALSFLKSLHSLILRIVITYPYIFKQRRE
jgi:hypothetical protein